MKTASSRRSLSRRVVLTGAAAFGVAGIVRDAPVSAGVDPLPARVQEYLALHDAASRLSDEWRRRVAALEQRGFDSIPTYSYAGTRFELREGLSALADHFAAAIAAAPDAVAQARLERARDTHLRAAGRQYRRWRAAERALGVAAASARNNEAWDAVDAVDIEPLYDTTPHGLAGAIALLRLVRTVGWSCCDPKDHAGPMRALDNVVSILEQQLMAGLDATDPSGPAAA
jgi:hypothetical protein